MEDSGIESDSKILQKTEENEEVKIIDGKANGSGLDKSFGISSFRTTSELQKKIERQREVARRTREDQQARRGLLTRNRLPVPSRKDNVLLTSDTQPLVLIDSDESEDEFAVPRLSKQAHKEITQQLIKDGYNLDMEPDDEDLDLIPPRPVHERCICCNMQVNCCIQ